MRSTQTGIRSTNGTENLQGSLCGNRDNDMARVGVCAMRQTEGCPQYNRTMTEESEWGGEDVERELWHRREEGQGAVQRDVKESVPNQSCRWVCCCSGSAAGAGRERAGTATWVPEREGQILIEREEAERQDQIERQGTREAGRKREREADKDRDRERGEQR